MLTRPRVQPWSWPTRWISNPALIFRHTCVLSTNMFAEYTVSREVESLFRGLSARSMWVPRYCSRGTSICSGLRTSISAAPIANIKTWEHWMRGAKLLQRSPSHRWERSCGRPKPANTLGYSCLRNDVLLAWSGTKSCKKLQKRSLPSMRIELISEDIHSLGWSHKRIWDLCSNR